METFGKVRGLEGGASCTEGAGEGGGDISEGLEGPKEPRVAKGRGAGEAVEWELAAVR